MHSFFYRESVYNQIDKCKFKVNLLLLKWPLPFGFWNKAENKRGFIQNFVLSFNPPMRLQSKKKCRKRETIRRFRVIAKNCLIQLTKYDLDRYCHPTMGVFKPLILQWDISPQTQIHCVVNVNLTSEVSVFLGVQVHNEKLGYR